MGALARSASVLALAVTTAHAGPRPYAFTQGVDTLPSAQIELESWFGADNPRTMPGPNWEWWLGPVTGITDELEAGLFAIFEQPAPIGDQTSPLVLDSLRLQLSYLLAPKSAWPVDVRVRGEVGQGIASRGERSAWLSAIVSKDFDRLNVTANPGIYVKSEQELEAYFIYGVGASYDVIAGLRAGGELFGEGEWSDIGNAQHFVGPAVAYGRGRFWLSTSVGIGLGSASSRERGRLVLGVAF